MNEKIMDWRQCLVKNARVAERDDDLIKSLIESADLNLDVAKSIKQNDKSYSSIVVLSYDSLRMLLEALALDYGYKIYNHECYYSFLREILKMDNLAEKFNPVRLIRNGINYYGKRLDKIGFYIIYNDIIYLIQEIKNLLVKK